MKLPKRFSFIKYKKHHFEYLFQDSSIKIPSPMYPVGEPLEIFLHENTQQIDNKDILDAIDQVEFKIGQCYTNAENVVDELKKQGLKAEVYVGWMINGYAFPLHHAWVIFRRKYLIDISDHFDCFFWNLKERDVDIKNISREDIQDELIDFTKEALQQKTSLRCTLGKASKRTVYIGTKSSRQKGIDTFNKLMQQYPNHPCLVKGTDKVTGIAPLQKKIIKIEKTSNNF